jgi:hypothetical protein
MEPPWRSNRSVYSVLTFWTANNRVCRYPKLRDDLLLFIRGQLCAELGTPAQHGQGQANAPQVYNAPSPVVPGAMPGLERCWCESVAAVAAVLQEQDRTVQEAAVAELHSATVNDGSLQQLLDGLMGWAAIKSTRVTLVSTYAVRSAGATAQQPFPLASMYQQNAVGALRSSVQVPLHTSSMTSASPFLGRPSVLGLRGHVPSARAAATGSKSGLALGSDSTQRPNANGAGIRLNPPPVSSKAAEDQEEHEQHLEQHQQLEALMGAFDGSQLLASIWVSLARQGGNVDACGVGYLPSATAQPLYNRTHVQPGRPASNATSDGSHTHASAASVPAAAVALAIRKQRGRGTGGGGGRSAALTMLTIPGASAAPAFYAPAVPQHHGPGISTVSMAPGVFGVGGMGRSSIPVENFGDGYNVWG